MFYQHQPLVYWTSDRGLWRAAGMPSLLPRAARGFQPRQTWGTKGSTQIRHLHTRHRGGWPVGKQLKPNCWLPGRWWRGVRTQKPGTGGGSLANPGLSDLCSKQLPAWFVLVRVFVRHWRDKYRVNLTPLITLTICCVLWCWHCCWGPQMSSYRGSAGMHAVCQRSALAACHGSTRITLLIGTWKLKQLNFSESIRTRRRKTLPSISVTFWSRSKLVFLCGAKRCTAPDPPCL